MYRRNKRRCMLMRMSTEEETAIVQRREERIAAGVGKRMWGPAHSGKLDLGVTWQMHLKFHPGQQRVYADDAGR